MAEEILDRRASDNEYLHKDFHGALSVGIQYVDEHYGEEAVRRYLRQFTTTYYAPLINDVRVRGLVALQEHFEALYHDEDSEAEIRGNEDELLIHVRQCPAVTHMREHSYPVARLFEETTRTVNEAFCERTPFASELLNYDPVSGAGTQRFYRKVLPDSTIVEKEPA